jgi:hypothetical protein
MRTILKLLFICFTLILPFSKAHAEDIIKLCVQGVRYCAEYEGKDDAKYSGCMKQACKAFYPEKEREAKGEKYFFKLISYSKEEERVTEGSPKTCDYGLRKCDVLSYSSTYYWRCMQAECRRNDLNANPNCDLGPALCKDRLAQYRMCVNAACNHAEGVYDECTESKQICSGNLRSYYHCVYGVCLGTADQYAYYAGQKVYAIIEDRFGIKRRVEVEKHKIIAEGYPEDEQQAPAGVDPEEWVRDIPNERRIVSNPGSYMRCLMPTSIMECHTSDIASCYCSDGTKALTLPEYDSLFDSEEEIRWFREKNELFEQILQREFHKRGYYKELDKKWGISR